MDTAQTYLKENKNMSEQEQPVEMKKQSQHHMATNTCMTKLTDVQLSEILSHKILSNSNV
jgi:hypothetical protein